MRTFLGFPIAAASAGNVPFGQMQPQQRSMYARLFDRLNPGSDGMSDADKQAAIRQGLLGLAAGMASTGGQGTAGAIGQGLKSGLLAMNQSRADHLDRQMMEQQIARGLHDPAGLREHQALVEAATAGMDPDEAERVRRRAASVRLGIEGRAPSASAKTVTFEGLDGRTRTGIFDPMQRTIFGPTGETFSIDEVQNVRDAMPQMGGPSAVATPPFNPTGGSDGNPFSSLLAAAPDLRVTSQFRSPERNAEVGGVPNSYHLTGEAIDIGRPTPEQQATIRQWAQANGYRIKNDYADGHWHLEPARAQAVTNAPNAFTSRRPEDEAAAVTAAQQAAEIGFLPSRQQIEAQGAGLKETSVQDARTAAKRRAELPLARSSMDNALDGLQRMAQTAREIRDNPALGRITGVMGQFPDLPGSPAANVRAQLENTLRSQVGFGVLQAMRDASKTGGALGQVSNIENILLQENLAALANTQSAEALRQQLDKIIEYAEGAQQRLRDAFNATYSDHLRGQGGQSGDVDDLLQKYGVR